MLIGAIVNFLGNLLILKFILNLFYLLDKLNYVFITIKFYIGLVKFFREHL